MSRDLSVLIPARNERFLRETVADVLAAKRANTEIIVVLDGQWAEPPLPDHPDVTLVKLSTPIGQRAAVNYAARLSTARYVMKLDAHCAVAEGFDAELIATGDALGPDVTQIPAQKNLHVYDWVCDACGHRKYQGPDQAQCESCASPRVRMEMIWKPRRGTTTTSWWLDRDLHFQYGQTGLTQTEDICDVMTSLGACFVMRRERFWHIGGLDEATGSWGQMGQEIASKSWLSGGRHVVNKRTWFAHFFRVGGIGFPYTITHTEQERAREYARNLWRRNAWPQQVRPLSWLIEKFSPLPGWDAEAIDAVRPMPARVPSPTPTKGVVYYSDCRPPASIVEPVRRTIEQSGLPIVAVTLQPIDWPAARSIVLPLERGYLTMFRQILAGLQALDTDVVFFCEHDVLYAPEHFAFTPPRADRYYYNIATWKVDAETGQAITYRTQQTSGLCAYRRLLVDHYRKRVALVEAHGFSRAMGFEPGTHGRKERVDDVPAESWRAAVPNIDIRHGNNLTASRWRREQFRDQRNCQEWTEGDGVPGWGLTAGRFDAFLADALGGARG